MTIRFLVFGLAVHAASACGDQVLAGIVEDAGANPCASYVAGSLVRAGLSASEYCALMSRVCGFGEAAGTPVTYRDRADCEAKYGAETEQARACSAGYACEVAVTGSRSTCEGAFVTCLNP
jgi:hypothetical protein